MPLAARPASIAAALLVLAAPAFAADFYVDAVNGSDATGTGTSAQPWKTITHALAQLPGGHTENVRVAPGVHDAALGELFPLTLEAGVNLLGAGIGLTIVDAGTSSGIRVDSDPTGTQRVRGLTLRNGSQGVSSGLGYGFAGSKSYAIADCAVENTSGAALSIGSGLNSGAYLTATRVRISGCGTGLSVGAGGFGSSASAALDDCTIEACSTGISLFASQAHQGAGFVSAHAGLVRTRIAGCAVGIACAGYSDGNDGSGFSTVSLRDSLVAQCGTGLSAQGDNDVWIARSTVAGNTIGMHKQSVLPAYTSLALDSALLWGNQSEDFFASPSPYTAQHSNAPGNLLAGSGNLSLDPQYVDPANGDFRLLPSSPLIDRGDPTDAKSGTDLDLDPRVLDGDLDLVARTDIGFDEWNPVHLAASGTPTP
ncbi:MAG: DUF1565 domain-containing protein, partial [Planctomycetota bacterium]